MEMDPSTRVADSARLLGGGPDIHSGRNRPRRGRSSCPGECGFGDRDTTHGSRAQTPTVLPGTKKAAKRVTSDFRMWITKQRDLCTAKHRRCALDGGPGFGPVSGGQGLARGDPARGSGGGTRGAGRPTGWSFLPSLHHPIPDPYRPRRRRWIEVDPLIDHRRQHHLAAERQLLPTPPHHDRQVRPLAPVVL